jgi:hypothetical protein
MTSKSSNARVRRKSDRHTPKEAAPSPKLIQADAFDLFIEEQLKRDHAPSNDRSGDEVVCHVY